MSQESNFQTTLEALKPLLDRGNKTAQLFKIACEACDEKAHGSGCRDLSLFIGKNSRIHFYMSDVINMYERRNDGYNKKYYPLFNEKSKHIDKFRYAIHRVKEVFSASSKEYRFATDLSIALEKVIAAAKPFQGITGPAEGNDFQVISYPCGMVAREFGVWREHKGRDCFFGNAIIEVRIEDLRHLIEKNALTSYNGLWQESPNGLDFRIIFKDGSIHTFNWKKPGATHYETDIDQSIQKEAWTIREKQDATDADIRTVEDNLTRLVLELEKSHPPLIDTSLWQKRGGNPRRA